MQRNSKKKAGKIGPDHSAHAPPGLASSSRTQSAALDARLHLNGAPAAGCLWVVATPIGNLEDISARALRCLTQAHCIYCEDTRTSGTLLRHYGIQTPTKSLHEHNENSRIEEIVQQLHAGQHIALISDAGTPLISDPGYPLVAALRSRGLQVLAIPGPSALTAALSVAGIACQQFYFAGFLAPASTARREQLKQLSLQSACVVFYESSHRIQACIADCLAIFGPQRQAAVVKEISKHFERTMSGGFAAINAAFASDASLERGEFVVVIAGAEALSADEAQAITLMRALVSELKPAQAARLTAKITGLSKRAIYHLMQAEISSADVADDVEQATGDEE
jgi:16S rRNA (cytidine1402-2'-O)-methyltransferase